MISKNYLVSRYEVLKTKIDVRTNAKILEVLRKSNYDEEAVYDLGYRQMLYAIGAILIGFFSIAIPSVGIYFMVLFMGFGTAILPIQVRTSDTCKSVYEFLCSVKEGKN